MTSRHSSVYPSLQKLDSISGLEWIQQASQHQHLILTFPILFYVSLQSVLRFLIVQRQKNIFCSKRLVRLSLMFIHYSPLAFEMNSSFHYDIITQRPICCWYSHWCCLNKDLLISCICIFPLKAHPHHPHQYFSPHLDRFLQKYYWHTTCFLPGSPIS